MLLETIDCIYEKLIWYNPSWETQKQNWIVIMYF